MRCGSPRRLLDDTGLKGVASSTLQHSENWPFSAVARLSKDVPSHGDCVGRLQRGAARAMSSLGSTQSADRLLYWRVGTCVHATSARCPLGARPHLPEFVVWMCPVVVGPCHALPTLRSGADGLNLRARVAAHSPSNAPISGHSCVNRSSKALLCHKCSQRSRPRQREANGRCQSLRMRACMVLQTHAQNKHAHRPSVLLRCWPLDLPLPRLPSLPARRHI